MKKILFITSFYSGLRKSVETGIWQPEGMPALYKLLEELNTQNVFFDYIFIHSSKTFTNRKIIISKFPKSIFYLVPKIFIRFTRNTITDILFAVYISIWLKCNLKLNEYEAIYLDRANVTLAPFLKKIFKCKIILRLHGIGQLLEHFEDSYSLFRYGFRKLCFNSQFEAIICSKDGTPGNLFIKKYCGNSKNNIFLLNGIDNKKHLYQQNSNNHRQLTYLFVARLEEDKGIIELINFLKKAYIFRDKLFVKIVGGGKYYNQVMDVVNINRNIKVYGSIKHVEVYELYKNTDVLISLNKLGNLCNSVLEAIAEGLPIITFSPDETKKRDIDTYNLLNGGAIFINRYFIAEELITATKMLLTDDNILNQLRINVKKYINPRVPSWADRIKTEVDLIKIAFE